MKNISNILQRCNSSMNNIIKSTVFLADMGDYKAVNEEYAKWFTGGTFPTRSCVAVAGLPKAAKVEVDAIAYESSLDEIQNVNADDIPAPIGPYTVAKRISAESPLVFVSGTVGDVEEKFPEKVGE